MTFSSQLELSLIRSTQNNTTKYQWFVYSFNSGETSERFAIPIYCKSLILHCVEKESVMLLEAVRRLKVQELLAYVHESCQAGTAREFKEVVRSNMEVDGKSKLVDYVPVLKWIDLQGIRLRMTGFFGKVISVFDSGSKHIAIKEKSCFSSNRRCTGYSSRQRGQLAFDTDVGFTPDVALDGWLRSFTPLLGSLKMDSLQRIWTWNTSLGLSAEGSQPTCYPNASSENRLTVFSCAGAPQFPASITYR
ncbi:unnamed protein product [Ilex paraguariensis]|uniref:Uncharacterized protein n=1 Tax=Ilex paraguariensis TaxID=185542 RepID=A0ABC8TTU0_9AQUA